MSIMRRLSLLAIGALLVLAVGASAASATTVHSGSTTGPVYSGNTTATLAASTTANFTSGFVNISCTKSTIVGDVSVTATNEANVSSANWTNNLGGGCTNNIGGTSTSTASINSASLKTAGTCTTNSWQGGSVAFVGTAGHDGDLTIACVDVSIVNTDAFGTTTTCRYTGSGANGSVTGVLDNAAGTVKFTNAALTKVAAGSGALCSGTATYSGTYDLRGTGGVRLYVTA